MYMLSELFNNVFNNSNTTFNKRLRFEFIVVFVVSLVVVKGLFPSNYINVIILLLFGLWLAYSFVNVREQSSEDTNKTTMSKLLALQDTNNKYIAGKIHANSNSRLALRQQDIDNIYKRNNLDYLFVDASMIHFLHSILHFNEYNGSEFFSLLKGVNNILKIRYEIEEFWKENNIVPENTAQMFEIALQLRRNTINNMHNFIYSIPKLNRSYDYHTAATERFTVLVTRNTDIIHKYYKLSIQNISSSTKFVSYNTTKPNDTTSTTATQFWF